MKLLLFASYVAAFFGCSARASNSTDDQLRRMQREISLLKIRDEALKNDYDYIITRMRTLENYYDEKIATLEHQLGSRAEVRVSFSVRLTVDVGINDSPVIFDVVDLNIGDGYDEFTGGFRAPVNGVYVLTFYGLMAFTDSGSIYVKKNDNVLCQGWFQGNRESSTSTCTAVAELTEGDSVRVTGSSTNPTSLRGGLQSGFTGFLINAN